MGLSKRQGRPSPWIHSRHFTPATERRHCSTRTPQAGALDGDLFSVFNIPFPIRHWRPVDPESIQLAADSDFRNLDEFPVGREDFQPAGAIWPRVFGERGLSRYARRT